MVNSLNWKLREWKGQAVKGGFYSLCITLFLLSFNPVYSRYAAVIFLAFGLTNWITFPSDLLNGLKGKWVFFLPFIAYFILHVIPGPHGTFNWSVTERQLMFIIAPLFGYPVFRESFTSERKRILIIAFLLGIITSCCYLLFRAGLLAIDIIKPAQVYANSIDSLSVSFLAKALSHFQHPSYFSLEINIAIILLVLYGKEIISYAPLRWIAVIFMIIIVLLLSSRAGLIGLSTSGIILIWLRRKELAIHRKYAVLIISAIILIFTIFLATNSKVTLLVKKLSDQISNNHPLTLEEVEPRINVWSSSLNLIRDNPWKGYGVIEGQARLTNEYRKNGHFAEAFFTLNCHNQFLESQLSFGISGSIVLLWMIFGGFFLHKGTIEKQLYTIIILLFIINFMFESMLVRQWGIMLFVLFSCLLNYTDDEETRVSSN